MQTYLIPMKTLVFVQHTVPSSCLPLIDVFGSAPCSLSLPVHRLVFSQIFKELPQQIFRVSVHSSFPSSPVPEFLAASVALNSDLYPFSSVRQLSSGLAPFSVIKSGKYLQIESHGNHGD